MTVGLPFTWLGPADVAPAAPWGSSCGARAISVDTLVEGVHFDGGTTARDLGHKALAVNLSDLAAMGADPAAALVSLTLPGDGPSAAAQAWLGAFASGFSALAQRHRVVVRGAYVWPGPLSITVEIYGCVPQERALLRSGARAGDDIYVTGSLGDAGFALRGQLRTCPASDRRYLLGRLYRPTPRVAVGRALRGLASAAIDVSDGLASDLLHLLAASGVGAEVQTSRLPLSSALRRAAPPARTLPLALTAGDDYELAFTAAPRARARLARLGAELGCPMTRIGRIDRIDAGVSAHDSGLGRCRWLADDGRAVAGVTTGFRHF